MNPWHNDRLQYYAILQIFAKWELFNKKPDFLKSSTGLYSAHRPRLHEPHRILSNYTY